jgi:ADP-heptose:LPS heptosyltransferase
VAASAWAENLDSGQTISVQRLLLLRSLAGLGDFLCVVPALRALRLAFPHAQIHLVGLPQNRALVDRFGHYIDELIEFPGFPGLPERSPQLAQIPTFLAQMQQQQFDLAIQMHGSGSITNPLLALFKAQKMAGFFLPGNYCPDPLTFLPFVESESEIRRYLRLLNFLGISAQEEGLEFPLSQGDWQEFATIAEANALQFDRYVCVHPGASVAERRWSLEHFASVADWLADKGFRVVLTGSSAEKPLGQVIGQLMRSEPIDLMGKTSLGALAGLLKQSRLLVCNDTGVSHLAAALKVPSVVIFSQSEPSRWAPLDRDRHRVVQHSTQVSLEAVLREVDSVLRREFAHVA